ncbi:unnamed protein product [Brassica napus]|uniref:(rape) hypothetical protein n=1 Tax=Brassica napus TaxID=3708 RepID=A0A816N722_BRANA|nr:unnamed protein product [Brassica napus]
MAAPPLSLTNKPEFWNRMEEVTREIIEQVHPTLASEDRRRDVTDYMQRLIKMTLGCEVHAFGSVPLKTYLPDGDIDLTAFGGPWNDDELAHKVLAVLENEREKHNVDARFIIKDVKLIRAEVKLVTCLVQNLVVDISFNQLGGISTLCFLEKMDHLIGKDHLFKRSIILIKAWCFYESHILGAVHGLISTYALETLVLYIFNLFHSSLDGPLAVLYKFLEYFSKFDWDKYCISLSGPVCRSSPPEIVVDTPENGGQDLLLTSDFLNDCLVMYCNVPSQGLETNPRAFPSKYLNIIDPLKENNNLGRSVNKANFNRIRTAFTFGARKLRQIILQSEEDISFELRNFFSNMLLRKHRSDHHSLNRIENGEVLNGNVAEKLHENSCLADSRRVKEDMHAGTPNVLADLTGDNDSQFYSLVYGRWQLGYVQNGPMSPLWTQLPDNNSWEVFPHALPFIPDNSAHVFHMNPQMIPNADSGLEELTKHQETGTYFSNMVFTNTSLIKKFFLTFLLVQNQYGDRQRLNNGGSTAQWPSEMNFRDGNSRERRHHHLHHYPNQTNGCCDISQAGILGSFFGTNGFINHPCEPLPAEVRDHPEGSKQSDIATSIPSSMQEDRYIIFSDTIKTSLKYLIF